MLDELCKYHSEWIRMAYSFLNSKEDAEDLVQDMYLRLVRLGITLDRIRYNNSINKYFMYITIRNMALLFIKNRKHQVELTDFAPEPDEASIEALDKLFIKVQDELNTWNLYDRTLFECYMYSGLSYRDIAYGTDKKARLISNHKFIGEHAVKTGNGISVSSMFNTIKNCKAKLKEVLGEDFEDYFNNEFDRI